MSTALHLKDARGCGSPRHHVNYTTSAVRPLANFAMGGIFLIGIPQIISRDHIIVATHIPTQ